MANHSRCLAGHVEPYEMPMVWEPRHRRYDGHLLTNQHAIFYGHLLLNQHAIFQIYHF